MKDECEYNLEECTQDGDCMTCCEGRYMEVVNEYASTCDECGELTHHDDLTMNENNQLAYCEWCIKKEGIK